MRRRQGGDRWTVASTAHACSVLCTVPARPIGAWCMHACMHAAYSIHAHAACSKRTAHTQCTAPARPIGAGAADDHHTLTLTLTLTLTPTPCTRVALLSMLAYCRRRSPCTVGTSARARAAGTATLPALAVRSPVLAGAGATRDQGGRRRPGDQRRCQRRHRRRDRGRARGRRLAGWHASGRRGASPRPHARAASIDGPDPWCAALAADAAAERRDAQPVVRDARGGAGREHTAEPIGRCHHRQPRLMGPQCATQSQSSLAEPRRVVAHAFVSHCHSWCVLLSRYRGR